MRGFPLRWWSKSVIVQSENSSLGVPINSLKRLKIYFKLMSKFYIRDSNFTKWISSSYLSLSGISGRPSKSIRFNLRLVSTLRSISKVSGIWGLLSPCMVVISGMQTLKFSLPKRLAKKLFMGWTRFALFSSLSMNAPKFWLKSMTWISILLGNFSLLRSWMRCVSRLTS